MKSYPMKNCGIKPENLRSRLAGGETLDDILPEAYAVVREAAKRTIGMRHYRVQLIGGVILASGTYHRDDVPVKVRRWYLHFRHI